MKRATIGLTICISLAIHACIARAQNPSAEREKDSASLFAAAAKLPRATNSDVTTSQGSGQVVAFGSAGYILKSNDDYLPRVALTNATDADFHALLESKTVYDALTIFGNNSPRTTDSGAYESRMRAIWLAGKSLSEKIRTRTTLLDQMRGYNDAVAAYAASVGFAQNATAIGKNAVSAQENDSVAVSNATQQLASADSRIEFHIARRDLRQANADLGNQTETANGAATMTTAMQQRADSYKKICAQYADLLAQYNLNVRSEPPYALIPPLSMRLEVDVDRVAANSGK